MTENEAIERIKEHMEIHKLNEPRAFYITEAFDIAITALKEIQKYREIGTVDECRKAVEKQKVKTVNVREWSPSFCPTCKYELSHHVGDGFYKNPTFLKRCPKCGQAIQWNDDLEGMEDE